MMRLMNKQTTYLLIGLGAIIGLFAGFAIAHMKDRHQDFEQYIEAREAAPDKEAFDRNFEAMARWLEEYKRQHPGATDADAQKAFEDAWRSR